MEQDYQMMNSHNVKKPVYCDSDYSVDDENVDDHNGIGMMINRIEIIMDKELHKLQEMVAQETLHSFDVKTVERLYITTEWLFANITVTEIINDSIEVKFSGQYT
jgi:hypothetical protein